MTLNFRVIWYSVLIWIFAFLVSGIVVIPWFYVVLPLVILLVTVYYFDTKELSIKRGKFKKDKVLVFGLAVSISWFFLVSVLSLFEIMGFYYFDFTFYFLDLRNWFLFPLVLLVPVVYGIVLDNKKFKRKGIKLRSHVVKMRGVRL